MSVHVISVPSTNLPQTTLRTSVRESSMLAFIMAVAPALARPMPQVPGMRAAAPVPVYYDHDHEVCAHKAHSTRTPRATHRKAHGSLSNRFRAIELPGPQVDASDGAQCVVGPTGNQTAAAAV